MFEDRKNKFEKKFQLDSEVKFKITTLRNKFIGKWAAEVLKIESNKFDAYIEEVIDADFEKPGYYDVINKISKDFKKSNIKITDLEIEKKIIDYEVIAKEKILDKKTN